MLKLARILALAFIATIATGAFAAWGQELYPNPTAPKAAPPLDPRLKAWDGIWKIEKAGDLTYGSSFHKIGIHRGQGVPVTPEWQKKVDEEERINLAGGAVPSTVERCIPAGMPLLMRRGFDLSVRPRVMTMIFQAVGTEIRRIWIDGRQHTPDEFLLDTFSGESVAHWEGNAVVVDTVGLAAINEFIYGIKGTKLHITEKMQQTSPGHLQVDFAVEDPQALTKPWLSTTLFQLINESVQQESYCVPALDRSVDPLTGEQTLDLTPPGAIGIGVQRQGN